MNWLRVSLLLMLFYGITLLSATEPVVSNVTAAQRTDGSKMVDIWYDLEFTGIDSVFIKMEVSENAGSSFDFIPLVENLSGNVGWIVQSGNRKQITWNMNLENRNIDSNSYVFKVIANGITPNPMFNPPAGLYTSSQTVVITCLTQNTTIRYTIDGTDPIESSNIYNNPISISSTTTLKARAFKTEWNPSPVVSAIYTITGTVATPIFNPAAGTYASTQNVSISCATSGAITRYTTDGSDPTETSSIYSSPLNISTTTTVKTRAYKTDWNTSSIGSAIYTITGTVATPTFSPVAGIYTSAQNVTISCTTPGATIRYTTDGSDPTGTSTIYSSPININTNSNITLKARAYKVDWNYSPTASSVYTITGTVATPTFSPIAGTYISAQSVTISCATSGATIRYTTNGTDPTISSSIYSSPINISTNSTLKARAFKTEWTPSAVGIAAYSFISMPANFVLVSGGTYNNGTSDVTVSSFCIDKYELTQSAFQSLMGFNPAVSYGVGASYPVHNATWFYAIWYSNLRSINEGLTPCYSYSTYGTNPSNWPTNWYNVNSNHTNISCDWSANGYRLPTAAEWEFAARGGNQSGYYIYSGSNTIGDVAWYNGNSNNTTHPVGTRTANELGIFDMSGNTWEWTWDIYGSYPSGAQLNPHGPSSGSWRSHHGGSFDGDSCAVSSRWGIEPRTSNGNMAFRVCRIIP